MIWRRDDFSLLKRAVKFAGKTAAAEAGRHVVVVRELQGSRAADVEVWKDRAGKADKRLEEETRRPTGRDEESTCPG